MTTMHLINEIYYGAEEKPSLYDLFIPENWNNKLIVFIHGFMGYKDWGAWPLVQNYFTEKNYGFLKFNMSHNGGTTKNPVDFDDPKSFASNTYSKELIDLEKIIHLAKVKCGDSVRIFLIGHSRGGGIALLQSTNDDIRAIASCAGISSIQNRFPSGKELEHWRKEGVRYQFNSRTKQQLPIYYEQYQDYLSYADRLNIEKYCRTSTTPTIVIHGENDTSVSIDEGKRIADWLGVDLHVINDTQHTFGSSQPRKSDKLPAPLKEVCDITHSFFETIEV